MTRQANAIDFWRGFALITIFINHVPGIYYTRFTHANYSLSDSADLFVFLAGWALRYVVGTPAAPAALWYLVLRLGGRALTLYAAQILITMIAIAMLAGAAVLSENPLLLEWHNAAAVFQDPIPTHVGLALLTHQLGYFNILPLYVVLMLIAPLFVLIDRFAPHLVLPVSLTIYFVTLALQCCGANLAGRGRVVLKPAGLAAHFRAGLRAGPPGRGRRFCTAAYRAAPHHRRADRGLRRFCQL